MSIVRLDTSTIINRLRWRSEPGEVSGGKPKFGPDYKSILVGADTSEMKSTELVVNSKLSLLLDCSIDPIGGYSFFHALVAPNPKLLEAAEVSYAPLYLPDQGRVRPIMHLRGLRKLDLASLPWVASIHLID